MRKSWSASAGVRTAVGSSRIRISAWWWSAFRISTRCCMPTGRCPVSASSGTSRPYSRAEQLEAGARLARGPLPSTPAPLGPEDHVLQDREPVDQHEVLVHHADPGLDRVAGAADLDPPAR